MAAIRIVDVSDADSFALVPPCADPRFDHRTCDYWEDADRGSKAARTAWLQRTTVPEAPPRPSTGNPFLDDVLEVRQTSGFNPFTTDGDDPVENPFAPKRVARPTVAPDAPRKLGLLGRGLGVFGSYAKLLLDDGAAVGYTQFGPLSAYPRALRLRELYPQLPDAPLPAVITCIATTPDARGRGLALRLVEAVCEDLAERGFAAVEAYPERATDPDATSAASPQFWLAARFALAVDDECFPVVRRELD